MYRRYHCHWPGCDFQLPWIIKGYANSVTKETNATYLVVTLNTPCSKCTVRFQGFHYHLLLCFPLLCVPLFTTCSVHGLLVACTFTVSLALPCIPLSFSPFIDRNYRQSSERKNHALPPTCIFLLGPSSFSGHRTRYPCSDEGKPGPSRWTMFLPSRRTTYPPRRTYIH